MARQIEINTPQFNVPVVDLGSPGNAQAQAFEAIGALADKTYDIIDKQQQKEGAINAAKAASQYQMDALDQINKDNAEGKIDEGYTGQIDDHLQQFVKDHKSQITNQYEQDAFDAQMLEVQKTLHFTSAGHEVAARSERAKIGAQDAMEANMNSMLADPRLYDQMRAANANIIANFHGDPATVEELKKGEKEMALAYVRRIMHDDPWATKKLLESPEGTKLGLDPSHVPILADMADADIRQREATQRANDAQGRVDNHQSAVDTFQAANALLAYDGTPPSPEQWAAMSAGFGVKEMDHVRSALNETATMFNMKGDVDKSSLDDLYKRLAAAKPDKSNTAIPFDQQERIYNTLRDAVGKAEVERRVAPATAAVRGFENVRELWNAYDANPSPATAKAATNATRNAQTVLGTPTNLQQVMEQHRADDYAAQLNAASPDDAVKMLTRMENDFGPDDWNRVFMQMKKTLAPAMLVAPVMSNLPAAAQLIEGSKMKIEDLRGGVAVTGEGQQSMQAQLANDPAMKDFMVSLSQRRGGGALAKAARNAAEILALQNMRIEKTDQSTAQAWAIDRIVKDNYSMLRSPASGILYRLPTALGLDPTKVESNAGFLRDYVIGTYRDKLLPPRGVPGLPPGMTRDQFINSVSNNARWVTNDSETGIILYANGAPLQVDGNEVAYTFKSIADMNLPIPRSIYSTPPPGVPTRSIYSPRTNDLPLRPDQRPTSPTLRRDYQPQVIDPKLIPKMIQKVDDAKRASLGTPPAITTGTPQSTRLPTAITPPQAPPPAPLQQNYLQEEGPETDLTVPSDGEDDPPESQQSRPLRAP